MDNIKNINIIHLTETPSTNSYAKKLLAKERPPDGTVIYTDYQTAGKGHDNNCWESHKGENLLLSMILYPNFLDISKQFNLSMAIALGITDLLKENIPEEQLYIKWPNDIYVGNEKISGILINNEIMGEHFEHVIVGIGINVNQTAFSKNIPNPTSMKKLSGNTFSPQELISSLSHKLFTRMDELKSDEERTIIDYHASLLGLNEWRYFIYEDKKIKAMITGVNEFGNLMLDTESRSFVCDLKEIAYLF
jgi:BirA family biotin operon repressor/biotin-[acetyl-CoA-carboxylase] ligase